MRHDEQALLLNIDFQLTSRDGFEQDTAILHRNHINVVSDMS